MNVKHVPGADRRRRREAAWPPQLCSPNTAFDSLLVEKRREVFIYPKARNLSFRSLEILRGLGLADEVHAVAEGVSDMLSKPTLNSTEESRRSTSTPCSRHWKD